MQTICTTFCLVGLSGVELFGNDKSSRQAKEDVKKTMNK